MEPLGKPAMAQLVLTAVLFAKPSFFLPGSSHGFRTTWGVFMVRIGFWEDIKNKKQYSISATFLSGRKMTTRGMLLLIIQRPLCYSPLWFCKLRGFGMFQLSAGSATGMPLSVDAAVHLHLPQKMPGSQTALNNHQPRDRNFTLTFTHFRRRDWGRAGKNV